MRRTLLVVVVSLPLLGCGAGARRTPLPTVVLGLRVRVARRRDPARYAQRRDVQGELGLRWSLGAARRLRRPPPRGSIAGVDVGELPCREPVVCAWAREAAARALHRALGDGADRGRGRGGSR
ncbi:MAG: hypothetical protein ACFCGT_12555 [Sandaracinaceae bacterium]